MRWSLQTSLYMHTIWSSLVTHTGPAASWSSHSFRAYPVPPAWEPPCLPIMVSSFRFAAMPAGLPSLSARQVLSLSLALASLVIFVCIAFVAWVFRFFLRFFLFSFWYLFFFCVVRLPSGSLAISWPSFCCWLFSAHIFRFLSFYVANFWLIVVLLKLFMIGQRISFVEPKVFDSYSVVFFLEMQMANMWEKIN